jgi:hypothetical protein
VIEHLWDATRKNWGYGGLPKDEAEYRERYVTSLDLLIELRHRGIAAGVYTQTTDVEGEINGLMTYDRKVIKIPAEELAELHRVLFDAKPATDSATPGTSIRSSKSNSATSDAKQEADTVVQFSKDAFIQQKSDRKPGPVMDPQTIRDGLKSHDRALYIKSGWIRDPFIVLGPDDYYYLTGTQPNPDDPRASSDPYNLGLSDESIVGDQVRVWRSKDLIQWESLGSIFSLRESVAFQSIDLDSGKPAKNAGRIWAPEIHWLGDRWALVHCPKQVASLAVSAGSDLKGPWTHPMGTNLGERHDPSIFIDDDGSKYLLWQNTLIAPLSEDLTRYTADPVRIDPSSTRISPLSGKPIRHIGHEGATMLKVGDKYVHLGTAWSTDLGRKGSYNLYYCVADQITGPYGPRKFAGRFLGHGTPFQDRSGQWWCTAFFNANVPPVPRDGIETRNLSENAQTINEQGVTIVPLDVRMLDNGEVYIRAIDPVYANPGPDESQKSFE